MQHLELAVCEAHVESTSWDYWPNGGTGGFVCKRVVFGDEPLRWADDQAVDWASAADSTRGTAKIATVLRNSRPARSAHVNSARRCGPL